jgi:hypothetical protein
MSFPAEEPRALSSRDHQNDEKIGYCGIMLVHEGIPWFDVVMELAQLILLLVLLIRQRQQRKLALSGDEVAARVLILPVYVHILFGFLVAVVISVSFHGVAIVFKYKNEIKDFDLSAYIRCDDNPFPLQHSTCRFISFLRCSITSAIGAGCYSFVFEGLALLLLQQGAGQRSQRTAFLGSCIWATIYAICNYFYQSDDNDPNKNW